MRLLGSLRNVGDGDYEKALARAIQIRKDSTRIPRRFVTTIHKAKGREFDHVMIAHCGGKNFADDDDARRLVYVAMSRCRKSITFLVPGAEPSPLLKLS
ncbi:ATP-binding domain-containing protein [Verrucomicrobiota bacterium]